MHSKENFKSQRQRWNIYRWNKTMCEAWDLWERRTQRWNTAGQEMFIPEAEWPWRRFITRLHRLLMFQVLHKKKKEKKEKTQKAREIIFSLSFLGRLIIFHLTTALTVTKVLRAQLYLLSASRDSEFWPRANPWTGSDAGFQQLPWNSLLKSWPTTVGLRHLRSELLFFCFRTIVFKKCLLPCILKQYLRDCFTQGRRALNQVINSD